jgi:hypothetical protein
MRRILHSLFPIDSVWLFFACLLSVSLLSAYPLTAQKTHGLQPRPALIRLIDANLRQACNQYKVLMGNLPPDRLPRTYHVNTDKLETSDADWWTSGFYPGTLFYLYEFSGDTSLLHEALRRLPLLQKEQYNKGTHDLGFMMNCSFGNADRLARQGHMPRTGFDTVLLNSARSLSTRFNPVVGCIRSWDHAPWHYPVIIDNMMNLELLFLATHLSGDSSFYKIAVTHANTTLRNHFRPDQSSFHVIDYDTATGAVIAKKTAQGFADSSAWARGQAWGLYGYTMMYRCTRDPKYLQQAEAISVFLLGHPHLPADKVPYWDYDAPGIRPGVDASPGILRDASAAAIMASALLELTRYVDAEKGKGYLDVAETILLSLSSNNYKAIVGSNGGFILKHSVGNLPARSEVDVPLTYADYYFVEAMLRYKQLSNASQLTNADPKNAISPHRGVRMVPVALGWAKNSINAVVFRHNSIITYKDNQFIAFYDGDSRLVLGKRAGGDTTWQLRTTSFTGNTADAHNSISLMADGDGFLHVAWDHHNNPLRYCRSIVPGSLELTEKMPMTGRNEEKVTYPDFYKMPDGNLLFLYRDGASGNGNLVIDRYDTKQRQWTQLQSDLIDGEGRRNAYWQACVDDRGVVHLSWVWRESPDVGSNHDICYARSSDGGLSWQNSKGESYRIPITAAAAEYAWRVPMHSGLINQTSMCADAGGKPYIATYWRPAGSQVPQYQLLWHDGAKWNLRTLTQRVSPFSLEGMGTKRTPVSRPQLLLGTTARRQQAFLVFRDEERGDKVSVAVCNDFPKGKWELQDLATASLDAWEPTYDTELWKKKQQLDLFVEKCEQGDGERTEELAPQMISVLEWIPG